MLQELPVHLSQAVVDKDGYCVCQTRCTLNTRMVRARGHCVQSLKISDIRLQCGWLDIRLHEQLVELTIFVLNHLHCHPLHMPKTVCIINLPL